MYNVKGQLIVAVPLFLLVLYTGCKQKNSDWALYKADAASSSYSVLKQVDTTNVGNLKMAWTFSPDDAPAGAHFGGSECNPIVVDGVMYATSARHRVYAIDPPMEKSYGLSIHSTGEGRGRQPRRHRTGRMERIKNIIHGRGQPFLALDAESGKPIPSFGRGGKVSMNVGIRDDPKAISGKAHFAGYHIRGIC